MPLNEITFSDALPVDSYGPGFFRVGGKVIEGGVLILPSGVQGWAGFEDREPLLAAAASVDVLFVGTGAEIDAIPADFTQAADAAGMGVERMSSPQACRTYNILLSEGRRVALAALPVREP